MTRLYILTFEGKRAPDARVPHAHESGFRMLFVLVSLAFLSVVGDRLGASQCVPRSRRREGRAHGGVPRAGDDPRRHRGLALRDGEAPPRGRNPLGAYILAWAVAVIGGAGRMAGLPVLAAVAGGKPLPAAHRGLLALARHKFYVDEVYDFLIIRPFTLLSKGLYKIVDGGIIDGVGVGGTALVLKRAGRLAPYTQTGNAQNYATVMAVGLLVSIGVVLTWVLL
jgi:NADH-quinone oxidoreductase subunit L